MNQKDHLSLEDVQTSVIHEFSKTLEMFGLTPADARLFVTLYINNDPMTLDEMSVALGKSKTSMSTGIRSLLDQGLVERVWRKGTRKDLYQANENLYKKFMTSYVQKWLEATYNQKECLKEIEEKMNEGELQKMSQPLLDEANTLYNRIEDMISFHKQISHTFEEIQPANSSIQ
ncbi:GbsR/MarR family transcriptional regulator [Thalassobacillus sp. CUG 92003]|uniref:GbsR/MarR family transcriptional regulator n=1 Tax=Thalassobacillus sp. CUG 92003 TaxID=2736641 RepID=UPI0015E72F0E|nr:MarR family transcriptional regulator [Thalassobacillus sp. CUG 92003]